MVKFIDKIKKSIEHVNSDYDSKNDFSNLLEDTAQVVTSIAGMASSRKINTGIAVASLAVSLYSVGRRYKDVYSSSTRKRNFELVLNEGDDLYPIAMKWVMETYEYTARDSIEVRAHFDESRRRSSAARDSESVSVRTSVSGSFKHTVKLNGNEITVMATTTRGADGPEAPSDPFGSRNSIKMGPSRSLTFVCDTDEIRMSVIDELDRKVKVLTDRPAGFYKSSRWGNFNRSSIQGKPRTFSSVFLKEGQQDTLVEHLRMFLDNEETYMKVDIPYRTGIMLYGPPGSGKSSTAAALASEFGIDVYYVSLSGIDGDDSLEDCFKAVPPRSMLILEDIDVVSAVKDRDKEDDKGITMSGMLNVLDGMLSNHGVITVMTTNRLEAIDEAIVRPGRIDLQMELSNLDNPQLRDICEYFMGYVPENLPVISELDGISSAQLIGVFRKHVPDFTQAENDLIEFINEKTNKKVLVV